MLKTGRVITANTWFEMDFLMFRRTIAHKVLEKNGLSDLGVDQTVESLVAIVNHGRWIVRCPDCGGAEYAWEEGFIMCFSCFNEKVQHRFRPFIFPKQRLEIENFLLQRPLSNRNWNQDESLSQLKGENEEHVKELLTKEVCSHGMDNSSR